MTVRGPELSTKQVAKLLGVTLDQLYRGVHYEKFPLPPVRRHRMYWNASDITRAAAYFDCDLGEVARKLNELLAPAATEA